MKKLCRFAMLVIVACGLAIACKKLCGRFCGNGSCCCCSDEPEYGQPDGPVDDG